MITCMQATLFERYFSKVRNKTHRQHTKTAAMYLSIGRRSRASFCCCLCSHWSFFFVWICVFPTHIFPLGMQTVGLELDILLNNISCSHLCLLLKEAWTKKVHKVLFFQKWLLIVMLILRLCYFLVTNREQISSDHNVSWLFSNFTICMLVLCVTLSAGLHTKHSVVHKVIWLVGRAGLMKSKMTFLFFMRCSCNAVQFIFWMSFTYITI